MAFSEQSKITEILASPEATAIVEKYVPGFTKHPQLGMVKAMSLKTVASFPQAGIKPDMLKAIVEEFAKLG